MIGLGTGFCTRACEHDWRRANDPTFTSPKCVICGSMIVGGAGKIPLERRKTCAGPECKRRYNLQRNWTGTDPLGGRFKPGECRTFAKTCILCGEEFLSKTGNRKRCPACCKCRWCGEQLSKTDTKIGFCNQFCAGQWRKRHTRAAETLFKPGERRGEAHWNWQGGISPHRAAAMSRYEYKVWRFTVFKRDGFACVLCGAGGKLHAHHIRPWRSHPELRYDVGNGVTLCEPHHNGIGRREAEYEAQLLAYVDTAQPVLLLPEELERLRPFVVNCAHCGAELRRPRRLRHQRFHFCNREHKHEFQKAVSSRDWTKPATKRRP